jgi:hypothetical protein
MKPPERIRARKAIAAAICQREDLDLILKEFGRPTNEYWGGDPESYVLAMTEGAPDGVLEELERYATNPAGDPKPIEEPPPPGIWTPGYLRLFISHAHEDRLDALSLKRELETYGISAFVAHEDLETNDVWRDVIEKALRSAESFVAIMTPNFIGRGWTDQEVGFAVCRRILTVSIKAGKAPHGFLEALQAAKGTGGPPAWAAEINRLALSDSRTKGRMREAMAAMLKSAGTFKEAGRVLRMIELTEGDWTGTTLGLVEEAAASNDQVHSAGYGNYPDRVKAFVERERKRT